MFTKLLLYKERLYSFFVYLIVFLSSIFGYGDKDWGWHYKYGEYLITHGQILQKDIFSWTMYGYYWTNISWLFDPILYFLTRTVGFVGLSIIAAFINLITFFILIFTFKLSFWKKLIVAIFFILVAQVGVEFGLRSQVLSNLFFAILIFLLIKVKNNTRLLFFFPVLFLTWVNFHADFTLGLLIEVLFFSCYCFVELIRDGVFPRKMFFLFSVTILASFAITLINPYGINAYLELYHHATSPYLRYVQEWQSIYQSCPDCHPVSFLIYSLTLCSALIYFFIKKNWFALPYSIVLLLLFIPTVETKRLLPVFCILTIPLLAEWLKKIKWDMQKLHISDYLFLLIISVEVLYNVNNRFSSFNFYHFSESDYTKSAQICSLNTINYLISHPPKGKGFNYYDWGGYLIGKGIPVKVYIDGRMHVWNKNDYSVFGENLNLLDIKNHITLFNNKHFDWVLIPPDSDLADELYNSKDLGNWKLAYQDETADYFIHQK